MKRLLIVALLVSPAFADQGGGELWDLKDLFIKKKYKECAAAARKQLAQDKDDSIAWRYLGASSCHVGDKSSAAEAWEWFKKLHDKPNRKWIESECAKDGIKFEW